MFDKKAFWIAIIKHLSKAGAAVIITVLAISFVSQRISSMSKGIAEKRRLAFVMERRQETAAQLRESFKQIGTNDARIEKVLPFADDILEFVSLLESLAKEYGLQYSFKFASPVVHGTKEDNLTLASIDYTLTLQGSITTFLSYLKRLETIPYITPVSAITISAPSSFGWEGDSTMTLQAQLFARLSD